MNILLCAATSMEITIPESSLLVFESLITGAGSPSTCFHLARKFSAGIPDLAIQIGIAGAFNSRLQIGDVVQVTEDMFADLGAQEADGNFIHISQLLEPQLPFGLDKLVPGQLLVLDHLYHARAITVNKVHGAAIDIEVIRQRLNPDIETMEGAAFFASCMAFQVPCFQLRSVSNRVEPRNRSAWNIPLALKNLHETVRDIVNHL